MLGGWLEEMAETSLEWQEYFSKIQAMSDALSCHIQLSVCLWIMDPHSRAPKKNISLGNEVLSQDAMHLIQRLCYQWGSLCQDPAGNQTTWRPPDHHKETQTILQGTVKRERRQGRQEKRQEDNIRECLGLEFPKSQRAAENREKWRKLVVKSSVVPQRPSRSRDRWWWWWALLSILWPLMT